MSCSNLLYQRSLRMHRLERFPQIFVLVFPYLQAPAIRSECLHRPFVCKYQHLHRISGSLLAALARISPPFPSQYFVCSGIIPRYKKTTIKVFTEPTCNNHICFNIIPLFLPFLSVKDAILEAYRATHTD